MSRRFKKNLKTQGMTRPSQVVGRFTADSNVTQTDSLTGYTVAYGDTGRYTVAFTDPHYAVEAVQVSVEVPGGTTPDFLATVSGVATTGFDVSLYDISATGYADLSGGYINFCVTFDDGNP